MDINERTDARVIDTQSLDQIGVKNQLDLIGQLATPINFIDIDHLDLSSMNKEDQIMVVLANGKQTEYTPEEVLETLKMDVSSKSGSSLLYVGSLKSNFPFFR